MPIGKFKGQPVAEMTTTYLMWLVCNDAIRFKRWPLVREALDVLRGRFDKFDDLLEEVRVEKPPPEYWKAKKPDRTAEKAEKLRQLEAGRAMARRQRIEAFRERRRLELEQELRDREEALHRGIDGYYFARLKKDADVSDLV